MEWLWCLGVLHPMQFFHTLMPFRLSPSFLGRVRRVWARREMVAMSMTCYGTIPIAVIAREGGEGVGEDGDGDNINDNDIIVVGTISVTVIAEGMAMRDGEGEEGWAWVRAMLRRRACR